MIIAMRGKVCYVLFGRYRGEHVFYHDLRMRLLSQLGYDVTGYVIKKGTNPNQPVFTGFTEIETEDCLTVASCLYTGLASVPECDYLYLSDFTMQPSFLMPSPQGSTCTTSICIPNDLRESFMDFIKTKNVSVSFAAFRVPKLCRRLMLPSPRKRKGEVCLVGNGPLSTDDRAQIANCAQVVRFNDTKNRYEGEQCDVHVMRRAPKVHVTQEDFYPVSFHDGKSKVILVGINANETAALKEHVIQRIQYVPPFDRTDQGRGRERVSLFEGCDASFIGSEKLERVSQHPSLGMIAISLFEAREDVESIHVYGMNFNFIASHTGSSERDVVNTCCRKCIVHPTMKGKYYPTNDMSFFALTIIIIAMFFIVCLVPGKYSMA